MHIAIHIDCPPWMKRAAKTALPVLAIATAGIALGGPPWNPGDTLKAADLNTLDTRIAKLEAHDHTPSAFHAEITGTGPMIPNNVGMPWTPVIFNDVLFDLNAEYSATTGKFTAKSAGTYLATCAVWYGYGGLPNGIYSAILLKNGNQGVDGTDLMANGAMNSVRPESVATVNLAVGDTLQCTTYQGSGQVQTLNTGLAYNAFSVTRIY